MKPVKNYIQTAAVAVTAELCWVNKEGEVSYRESTRQQSKKPAAPASSVAPWSKSMPPQLETMNTFHALHVGTSQPVKAAVAAKKKKDDARVLDDWESFED